MLGLEEAEVPTIYSLERSSIPVGTLLEKTSCLEGNKAGLWMHNLDGSSES